MPFTILFTHFINIIKGAFRVLSRLKSFYSCSIASDVVLLHHLIQPLNPHLMKYADDELNNTFLINNSNRHSRISPPPHPTLTSSLTSESIDEYSQMINRLNEIKSMSHLKDVAIAIYSTSASEEDIEETFVRGANVYIKKPNSFSSLKKVLSQVITLNWQYHTSGLNRDNFLLSI